MTTGGWALLLVVVFVASPLVDARLVRQGRISAHAAALLLVYRFPVFVALTWLLMGGALLFLALVEVPLVLMARFLLLPFAEQLCRDLAPDVGDASDRATGPPPR